MNILSKPVTLIPQMQISKNDGKTYYEQIRIDVDDYPITLIPVDIFWGPENRELYDDLRTGKILIGTMTFEVHTLLETK